MRRGFTLVEMVVTIGILGMVLAVTASMVNFSVGKLRSARTKLLTDTLRSGFDLIGEKINIANDKITTTTPPIYGFNVSNNVLGIVSSGESSQKTCTFFGLADNALKMGQSNDCTSFMTAAQLTNSLTSDKIKVISFTANVSHPLSDTIPTTLPKLEIEISGQEIADPSNLANIKTTFTMDYENIRYMYDTLP